jgi:hypothetical protein
MFQGISQKEVDHRSSWIIVVGPRGTRVIDLSTEIFWHFSISATGDAKGKSLGLLTHEIPKGSKPSDQGRLTAVDLSVEWNIDISGFGISTFRDLRV